MGFNKVPVFHDSPQFSRGVGKLSEGKDTYPSDGRSFSKLNEQLENLENELHKLELERRVVGNVSSSEFDPEGDSLWRSQEDTQILQRRNEVEYLKDKIDFERRVLSLEGRKKGIFLSERVEIILYKIRNSRSSVYYDALLTDQMYRDAKKYLKIALETYKHTKVYTELAAISQEHDQNFVEALQYCNEAIRLGRDYVGAYCRRIKIYSDPDLDDVHKRGASVVLEKDKQKLRTLGVHVDDKGNII